MTGTLQMHNEPKIQDLPELGNIKGAGLSDLQVAFSARPSPYFGPDNISVDSLKIRIPEQKTEIIDRTLIGNWALVHIETGQVGKEDARQNKVTREQPGIKVIWSIEKQPTDRRKVETFLTIGVPAKILRERYFEGIHRGNIDMLYNYLQAQNVARFDREDFLNGDCTDIDFKSDTILPNEGRDFTGRLRQLASSAKSSKHKDTGYRIFTSKVNKGIEFSDRKASNYLTHPYLKIYLKTPELLFKSKDFLPNISHLNIANIARIEATIKNRKHFRHLFGEGPEVRPTLCTLLSLTDELKGKVFDHAFCAHLERRRPVRQDRDSLPPSDLLLLAFIEDAITLEPGRPWDEIREKKLRYQLDKVARSRMRKRLDELFGLLSKSEVVDEIHWLYQLFLEQRA